MIHHIYYDVVRNDSEDLCQPSQNDTDYPLAEDNPFDTSCQAFHDL